MPSFQRPGAFINEVLTATTAAPGPNTANAVAAFTGEGKQGPTTPTLVKSWGQFRTLFGDFTKSTYLAYAVYLFFLNGGQQCWVTRVATASQVTGTRTLNDQAATPLPTLQINAYSPGLWGNSITIDATAGYTAGRFNLVVYYGGTALSNVVETWADLTMDPTDPRYVVSVINSALAGSSYIQVVDQHSATAAPANTPAVQTGTSLATGADGSAASNNEINTSINLLNQVTTQPVVLNLPGVTDTTNIGNAITWAAANNGFVVIDPPSGDSVSAVTTWAATLTASSYAAAYYPWIVVNDPSKYTPGTTLTLPPGGAVVGQYLNTDAVVGPFKTPAGVQTRVNGAVDVAATLQPSDYDTLNGSVPPVNAIKPVPGYGICVFGGRTLKAGFSDRYIAVRRSLIFIEKSLKNLSQFAIFEPNDARLWTALTTEFQGWLDAYWQAGGLAGTAAEQAYFVVCNSTNNTPGSVSQGVVNIQVGVALEYPAEFVVINIGQYEGGTTTVTNSLAA